MNDDDELSEEQIRRMEAKLLSGEARSLPTVEVRRSRRSKPKPVVEAKATPIPIEEGGMDSFLIEFKAVLPDGKRIHLRTIRDPVTTDHRKIIREYEDEGRIVRWTSKRPDEYPDDL